MPPDTKIVARSTAQPAVLDNNQVETSPFYTKYFFEHQQSYTRTSAERIVSKTLELIQPASVIDIGCGTGKFLATFREHGIEDILGIDGAYVPRNLLVIPRQCFVPFDLNQPLTHDRTYDLAVCLEVAEHLPPASASNFIASLARLAPIILFSAAIPYQGGTGHLNEQWPEYWAALFKQHDFVPVDALRRSIWHDHGISFWYRQNMLFFCKEEALAGSEKLVQAYRMTDPDALALVHPQAYLECNTKYLRTLRHALAYTAPLWQTKRRLQQIFRGKQG